MKFSERKGLVKRTLQVDSVDKNLRTKLWNDFIVTIDNESKKLMKYENDEWKIILITNPLFRYILQHEMIEPIDEYFTLPKDAYILLRNYQTFAEQVNNMRKKIRNYLLNCEWYKIYDFVEFLIKKSNYKMFKKKDFIKRINKTLEKEKSAYRIVENRVSGITDETEIEEIELVLQNPIRVVKEHINQALALFSDKREPDYRNSIKESISAVEAIAKIIVGDKKTTLGRALERLESKGIVFHDDLKIAFKKLYSYTSDADGIRHALMDESDLNQEDARFMLVTCSAFINYLTVKSVKTGIDFETQ